MLRGEIPETRSKGPVREDRGWERRVLEYLGAPRLGKQGLDWAFGVRYFCENKFIWGGKFGGDLGVPGLS